MESQPPPVPRSATSTWTQQSPSQHPTPPSAAHDDYSYAYNEKDAYQRQQHAWTDRHSRSSYRAHDSVISSHPLSPKGSSLPSPCSSINSTRGPHRNSKPEFHYSASDIEQQQHQIQFPPRAYIDPEKQAHRYSHSHPSPNRASAGPEDDAIVYDKGAYHEKGPEEKAWQLLFWLCGPCAFLSGAIALWTFFAILIVLLLAPLRLCTTRQPLSEQIIKFLAPALNLQLHMVYSHDATTGYSAPMLVIISLFSPIVAFGVAMAAWTAAGFWFFSLILGDPGGNDGHNDGKESIVGVRNWWERWLSRGLRETNA
ncbi:hypothetical protein PtrSN002B_000832 [Pyrenophora tritici-repentis]|uniref:Uncharacterized protein n=2 Tax=Pyrenophora tritici-repentis TaxID=45151 RepID=A0A2W1FB20_9PLEO|nr:uncharacterized protein PTRG_05644 [Pyrenophora tritici-repentis Pt-1C-BFP]KAA8618712.1 hypothetical protein PtrV1_08141 [Pyrenophora tritici-repentis]EDU48564.1 conserved hypothetical protein [Pyrenophora tritici-repentis Pt-1C-BFP]KAF7449186.1 hypothetical protein A1F99_062350 [Pyrenophora tritici-repentis]KAF7570810.1 hypothetical protein PtrM4_108120 [Pyrenophora tritici-repentis]KAG9383873.1 hypothetical protein A1F94_005784 [Pyrenophora tritici-repentis]